MNRRLVLATLCWAAVLLFSKSAGAQSCDFYRVPGCNNRCWSADLESTDLNYVRFCDAFKSGANETAPGCCQDHAGHPISLASGNTYIQQTDISLPGLGGGLHLVRTWNSMWPTGHSHYGRFGPNWRSNFDERVYADGNGEGIKYLRGDGSYWTFGIPDNSGASPVISPANGGATLTSTPDLWTVTFTNGEQRSFSTISGSLLTITDRNGNQTQLGYDAANNLVSVIDPAGRHLTMTYISTISGSVISSVTSDVGLALSYAYDSQGRLVQVTKPDQTKITFEYGSQVYGGPGNALNLAESLITAVKDNEGKVLETHSYDSAGRGTGSSRANDVERITIRYPNVKSVSTN